MRAESPFSCSLIGEKSLLVLCAEELLRRGHEIRGIATLNDEIRKWSADRKIRVVRSTNDEVSELLSDDDSDYLFSIVNYRVLPDATLRLAKLGAINFHDGPLPGYAGMHVTTWAIINGERDHGVSWHWMVKAIDGGGVLQERRFPIWADDTATSLNTRCFEAGFESFRGLLTDLERDTIAARPQSEPASGDYYALRKRPERMATLDWSRPAEELHALFRGLDFGRYENPIGCPKVIWGEQILTPGRFIVLEKAATKPAGTLETVARSVKMRVHTSTHLVEVACFHTLDGESIENSDLPALRRLEGSAPRELDAVMERYCVHETYWVERLVARDVVNLPYIAADIRRDERPQKQIRRSIDTSQFGGSESRPPFASKAVAAVALYLGRLSGKAVFDVDFQSLTASGLPAEAGRYFATSVPLRVELDWSRPVAEHVTATDKTIHECENCGVYARDLVLRFPQIGEERRQKLREISDVAIAVVPRGDATPEIPAAQLVVVIPQSGTALAGAAIELVANPAVIGEQLLGKIADEVAHVLAQVTADGRVTLADVSVVTPHEQAHLAGLNDATRHAYDFRSLPQLFEAQVERTPDATAVVFRGASLTYRQFNARANQLANLLIARGVTRGDIVGVLMDRSTEMVLSMYAALKAGAAYAPLDPAYPAHRLEMMAQDAQPKLILTDARRAAQVGTLTSELLVVDDRAFDGQSEESPHVAIEPDDVAYIIYTSGSTGRPKGATVTHANIQNLFLKIDETVDDTAPGTWLAHTSISFDISIPELFWTLTRGARVILAGSSKPKLTTQNANQAAQAIDFSLVFGRAAEAKASGLFDQVKSFAQQHGFSMQPGERDQTAPSRSKKRAEPTACVTADDDPETFRIAAEIGSHVLTRTLGQSFDSLAKNIALYRKSWKEAGHSGTGRVIVLLPTLVGPDDAAVKAAVQAPMVAYLKNELPLIREAAWEYPPFLRKADDGFTLEGFVAGISDEELTDLVEFAFERSYATGGLFGSVAHCLPSVERLKQVGVDEIACLIDFGLPAEQILEHLPQLNELKRAALGGAEDDADDFATLIEEYGVTHFQCTPPRATSMLWDARTRQAMTRLRWMIAGGEAMSEDLGRQLRSTIPGRVFNVYGPTETTVWSTMHAVTEVDGPVPIGKPIFNTQLYVVDERQQPLPIGVPGELLIGGDGVGNGYLRRPDMTAARFLETEQGTVYRTGDLVRLRPDGTVDFLGRLDDQVKIRGHRIELGEIEAVFETHPAVRKAVVHPQDDTSGGKRLVAYIVASSNSVSLEALRQFVSERLPEYMVPSHFETMSDLPLTPSGKVDRRALPKPNFGQRREAAQAATPPLTETEKELAELWQGLLEVGAVDRADNFFELGGHSLLGMRALSQILEKFGVRLATKSLLVGTLAQVAAEIDSSKDTRPTPGEGRRSTIAAALLDRFPRFLRSE